MPTIDRAIQIAAEAHVGQSDEGGRPKILHVLRVMQACTTDSSRIVALLHDVVEDNEWTVSLLREEGFDDEVLEALESVTRRDGEPYLLFTRRAARHPIGSHVRRADLVDKLDLARLGPPITDEVLLRLQLDYEALRVIDSEHDEQSN